MKDKGRIMLRSYFPHELALRIKDMRLRGYEVVERGANKDGFSCWARMVKNGEEKVSHSQSDS